MMYCTVHTVVWVGTVHQKQSKTCVYSRCCDVTNYFEILLIQKNFVTFIRKIIAGNFKSAASRKSASFRHIVCHQRDSLTSFWNFWNSVFFRWTFPSKALIHTLKYFRKQWRIRRRDIWALKFPINSAVSVTLLSFDPAVSVILLSFDPAVSVTPLSFVTALSMTELSHGARAYTKFYFNQHSAVSITSLSHD